MKKLGETYPKISNAQNAELRLRWGQIILKNDHQEEFWKVKDFLQSQVGSCISGPLTGCDLRYHPRGLPVCGARRALWVCASGEVTLCSRHAGVTPRSFVLWEEKFAGLGSFVEIGW